MKIEKGMAVNVEGMSDIVRQAVVKKFEGLGFKRSWCDRSDLYVGINRLTGNIITYSEGCDAEAMHQLITLPELMFSDQPDDVTHCYYDTRDGKLYYEKRLAYQSIKERELICTRDSDFIKGRIAFAFSPKDFGAIPETKSWYEKGELPPVGEVVEYTGQDNPVQTMILGHHPDKSIPVCWHQAMTDSFEDLRTYSVDGASYFRPIDREREKLTDELASILESEEHKSTDLTLALEEYKMLACFVYDAGWRPLND